MLRAVSDLVVEVDESEEGNAVDSLRDERRPPTRV